MKRYVSPRWEESTRTKKNGVSYTKFTLANSSDFLGAANSSCSLEVKELSNEDQDDLSALYTALIQSIVQQKNDEDIGS
jgi:hypothetical protein